MTEKILEKFGLKYDELTSVEREEYHKMLSSLEKSQLTPEKLKDYIKSMRNSVLEELSNESMKRPSFWAFMFSFRKDYSLKARLRNYTLLEAFLDTPKRAKVALEQALAGVGPRA